MKSADKKTPPGGGTSKGFQLSIYEIQPLLLLPITYYLNHELDVIADWPVNRVGELLSWRTVLPDK